LKGDLNRQGAKDAKNENGKGWHTTGGVDSRLCRRTEIAAALRASQ
jgi:hypothetical protein